MHMPSPLTIHIRMDAFTSTAMYDGLMVVKKEDEIGRHISKYLLIHQKFYIFLYIPKYLCKYKSYFLKK